MGILMDIGVSILFILLVIGFIGTMFDASKNKNYRRYVMYKSIRKYNKKKHNHRH